ncbi:MAG: bestrophin family ion channel [Armatimonadaceae bacterium]
MIVRKRLSVRRVIHYTGKETAAFGILSLLVSMLYLYQHQFTFLTIEPAPLTLIGSALTIFLGFRTNSAYARWWEARILWGGIVNYSRSFARQILTLPQVRANEQDDLRQFEKDLIYHQMAFVHATRCHLRRQDPFEEILPFLPPAVLVELRPEQNVPNAILLRMGQKLREAHNREWLDSYRFVALTDSLNELTNLLGGCERIKNTTLPRQYDVFPRMFIWIFNTVLPFALVKTLHWYTVPICTVIAFIFIVIDGIGSNIENPFENTIHDTPMTNISRTIEINLRQMLDEKDLPPKIEPIDGYLY